VSATAHRWVALLRGVNVGRANRIAMAELRALVEAQGGRQVRTLLASGNVVFDHGEGDAALLRTALETALAERHGIRTPVLVIGAAALDQALAAYPWRGEALNPSRVLLAFANSAATLEALRPLAAQATAPERLEIGAQAAYLLFDDGVAGSPLFLAMGRLKTGALTTRNLATCEKLAALALAGDLIGCFGGGPADLSSNPRHLDDFGQA
jgi:uncharacterized protein (DUF1697 family)